MNTITVKNNVMHDSYNNDILKINNACTNIYVEGNMFYNQTGSDEHIDLNSVENVYIRSNVFYNDFEGSGRVNQNNTSSYIVIKDSNQDDDIFIRSKKVYVRQNVFFNYQGSTGTNFVLLGEDGHPIHETQDILVENNLMIGNSVNLMRSSFGVKGGKNITFQYNTITGDLPSFAYAMRLNQEGSNPPNESINFYNNIWSDPTGTMGAKNSTDTPDFSDTQKDQTLSFTIDNNMYWNGVKDLPGDANELINVSDDTNKIVADPQFASQNNLVLPHWNHLKNSLKPLKCAILISS